MTTEFDDIRPYVDAEVPQVLARLSRDPEFLDSLTAFRYPRITRFVPWVTRFLATRFIQKKFVSVDSVDSFQQTMRTGLVNLLEETNTHVTVSGLEHLDSDRHYLLFSNHRDITMDSALVNLVFSQHGRDTIRSAAGDNLLSKPFASDMLRLNKSFVVKRSTSGRREKLRALTQLSSYIRYCIGQDDCSVWIAQREGRAKDGLDKTETALLKMLSLSKDKQQSFAEGVSDLNLVPVSIAYEFDPCDADKARELYLLATTGDYTKREHEDVRSIYQGVVGFKGHVHIAFGEPVTDGFETADELAEQLDEAIIGNYYLHPTNLVAYEMLDGADEFSINCAQKLAGDGVDVDVIKQRFADRLDAIEEPQREFFLMQYANPVRAAKALSQDAGSS